MIRKRFDDDVINRLLSLQWWNWSDEKLTENAKYINNMSKFIERSE